MPAHGRKRRGKKWRDLNRRYGSLFFIGCLFIGVLALVFLLMFSLTSMSCRMHQY